MSDFLFSQEQKLKMLEVVRDQALLFFGKQSLGPSSEGLEQEGFGVFVTWKNQGVLRGCMGCIQSPGSLFEAICEMTVSSLRDFRFSKNPITSKELKNLEIAVSVLDVAQRILSYRDIELGKHGIIIQRGSQRGLFLPQVATETGWSLEEFWGNCCEHKASIARDSYKDGSADLYRFSSEVVNGQF